jgi:hypothetical protein
VLRTYAKRLTLLFVAVGLLIGGIFYSSPTRAQEYDCGTYSAGDYGEGECTDETTSLPTTETPTQTIDDPLDYPVTDTDGQPDSQTGSDTFPAPDSTQGTDQDTDTAKEGEQRADNSMLLWLGFGLLAILALILGIWLILRRRKDEE